MKIKIEALPASLASDPVREWVDEEGGAPLRCCLRDSRPGERVGLVSATPPGPTGAYQETGPVFMHADGCDGPIERTYPDDFRSRPQIFRAYDAQGSIVGGELVDVADDHEAVAERLLADPGVAFLHTRNVVHGCYMLMIQRA